jgi:hypothetical protein
MQAFWKSLVDDLLLAPPCYVRVLRVLSEIRAGNSDLGGARWSIMAGGSSSKSSSLASRYRQARSLGPTAGGLWALWCSRFSACRRLGTTFFCVITR